MKFGNSIRRRVFAVFGLFTLLLCLVYSGICLLLAYVIEDQVLDNLVAGEARFIEQQFLERGILVQPRLPYFQVYTSANPPPEKMRAALPQNHNRGEFFGDRNNHFHLRRLQLGEDHSAILAAEVSGLLTVSRQFGDELLLLTLFALLATSLLAMWLAYRLAARIVKPVVSLAQTVQEQLHADVPVSLGSNGQQDEIGFLSRTLQDALNQLKLALRRESEFTRDVSHELRTAITIAKNTLTLAEHRQMTGSEKQQLLATVSDMENIVSTLLALARAESLEQAPLDLHRLVEQTLLARHMTIEEAGFQIAINLPERFPVQGNRHLAELLLGNLLDNALHHASHPSIEIFMENSALVISNPVAENVDIPRAIAPCNKSAQSAGMGQGLYLCTRLSELLEWDLNFCCENKVFRAAIRAKK